MFSGTHVLLYTTDADADRAFIRDVLDLDAIDAGGGWLIFALPPAELAVHPTDDAAPRTNVDARMITAHVYLMCDDVRAVVEKLEAKKVRCEPLATERWGIRTAITLPSGGRIGLYQPLHATAIGRGRA